VAIGDTKGHDEAKLRVTDAGWKAARPFWAKPETHRRRRLNRFIRQIHAAALGSATILPATHTHEARGSGIHLI